jgi:endonuclease/exonuclease/phosphatase family metal-dependent hydrolase
MFIPLIVVCCWLQLDGQQFSVMTFNIRLDTPVDSIDRWDNRKEDVIGMIRRYSPFFVGMQEALHHQVNFIDSSLSSYSYIGVGRDDGKMQGEYSPLFYDAREFECISNETFWLSQTPDKPSLGWEAKYMRICTYGIFRHRSIGYEVLVLNTHLDHEAVTARKESAMLLLRKINEINDDSQRPVVLIGDFNAVESEEPIRILTAQFEDALHDTRIPWRGKKGTWNGFDLRSPLDRRIDYLFSKNLWVTDYLPVFDKTKNNRWLSDHIPVMGVFSIKTEE